MLSVLSVTTSPSNKKDFTFNSYLSINRRVRFLKLRGFLLLCVQRPLRMKKDTEVSPHGLRQITRQSLPRFAFSECNTAQSLPGKTCRDVNLGSFDIITLSLCDIWKTNDDVMHKVDMTNSFTYERPLSDLERTGSTPET